MYCRTLLSQPNKILVMTLSPTIKPLFFACKILSTSYKEVMYKTGRASLPAVFINRKYNDGGFGGVCTLDKNGILEQHLKN